MKEKIEQVSSGLSEISAGLENYNALSIIKSNQNLFRVVFTPSNVFIWDYDLVRSTLLPYYSEHGSNKKVKEVDTYKAFLDFLEICFKDGKYCTSILKYIKILQPCYSFQRHPLI